MTHKIYNLIAILTTIGLTIFSYFKNYNIIFMLGYIFLTYIIIYIIINSILKEKIKTFILYPLIGILICTGISNLTNICITSATYLISLPENIKTINNIEKNDNYIKLFSYEDKNYYLTEKKDGIIGINKKSKFEGADILPLYKEEDLDTEILDKLKLFTSFDTSNKLTNHSDYIMHYGFINDNLSQQIIIRIIDQNQIYYTYIIPENLKDFLNNNTLFTNYFSFADFDIYFSEAVIEQEINSNENETLNQEQNESFSINDLLSEGKINTFDSETDISEIKNKEDKNEDKEKLPISKVLTLTNNGYYFTDVTFVMYENEYLYTTRLNNYLNKEILQNVEQLSKKKNENLSDTEKIQLETEIQHLENSISNYYIYLSDEIIKNENEIIRFYTAIDTENSENKSLTDINIIEIKNGSQYIIFNTEMIVNSLYSVLFK